MLFYLRIIFKVVLNLSFTIVLVCSLLLAPVHTSFSSIRLSCHVISLPTCTIGADRPTRNKFIDEAAVVGIMVVVDSFFTVVLDMTMSLYLFLDMYLHSGEYHVGTVGIDIRNYIFAVLMR